MAVSPEQFEQLRISPDFSRVPVTEARAAEISLIMASLRRLRLGGDIVREEDGSISQAVTLFSPDTFRIRRIKQLGVERVQRVVLAKGDISEGLFIAGYQLDEYSQFHGYLPSIRLPRIVSSREREIGKPQKRSREYLEEAAKEIEKAIWVNPERFNRFVWDFPYLGIEIGALK